MEGDLEAEVVQELSRIGVGLRIHSEAQLGADPNMVALRNFAIGLHCLQKRRGKTEASSLPSWRRSMKASEALRFILK